MRDTLLAARVGARAMTRGEADRARARVRRVIQSHAFRILVVLGAVGSSALALEAGRRWC